MSPLLIWAPLKEQNRQLQQELQATEEELTLCKRKAASWKDVHVKKVKTAAHAHATREDSSDSNFLRFEKLRGLVTFLGFSQQS